MTKLVYIGSGEDLTPLRLTEFETIREFLFVDKKQTIQSKRIVKRLKRIGYAVVSIDVQGNKWTYTISRSHVASLTILLNTRYPEDCHPDLFGFGSVLFIKGFHPWPLSPFIHNDAIYIACAQNPDDEIEEIEHYRNQIDSTNRWVKKHLLQSNTQAPSWENWFWSMRLCL